jgi:hypothetical protein
MFVFVDVRMVDTQENIQQFKCSKSLSFLYNCFLIFTNDRVLQMFYFREGKGILLRGPQTLQQYKLRMSTTISGHRSDLELTATTYDSHLNFWISICTDGFQSLLNL